MLLIALSLLLLLMPNSKLNFSYHLDRQQRNTWLPNITLMNKQKTVWYYVFILIIRSSLVTTKLMSICNGLWADAV